MIRLLIPDDHAILRQGLRQIVAETSDIAAEAEDAAQVMRAPKKWGHAAKN